MEADMFAAVRSIELQRLVQQNVHCHPLKSGSAGGDAVLHEGASECGELMLAAAIR
jgi:hypothetical protein